ncbi:MAG: C39 family peptidase [Clostridia bacterium]|nr:C39 family peptidase [Clostridia bacterium]
MTAFSVSAVEVSVYADFLYQPSGSDWTEFDGFIENESYIDCLKIQTSSSKSYYLSYQTYNEGKTYFYPAVTSIENDYAGLAGRRIQKLKINVVDKSTGKNITEKIVVMYRVKTGGRWLAWASSAALDWRYFVQRKYGLTGVIDKADVANNYAGLDDGSFITGIEIRIFEENEIITSLGESGTTKFFDVPYINQANTYPTGCESVSAVMTLQYYGLDITVDEFIDSYLEKGSVDSFDPDECFGGDPRSSTGMGCYAPVIERAVNSINKCMKLKAETLCGKSLNDLCKEYVDNDIPVIVWATVGMETPRNGKKLSYNGKTIQWIAPEHCLVLVGYTEHHYIFNDPLNKKYTYYLRNNAEIAYYGLGAQAVVVTPTGEVNHSFDDWVIDIGATCTTAGIKSRRCNECDFSETQAIEPYHNYNTEYTVDKQPTHFEEGCKSRHCINCDEITDVMVIPKTIPNGEDLVNLSKELLMLSDNLLFDYAADGKIDLLDLIRLKRYIAGENVTIG